MKQNYKTKFNILLICFIIVNLYSCKKEDLKNTNLEPFIQLNSPTNITRSSATFIAVFENFQGIAIEKKGLCWSLKHNPTINDKPVYNLSNLTKLTALRYGTTYYVRAFVTNKDGVFYSNEQVFNTLPDNNNYGRLLDQEGNIYRTIVIGKQEWMADNLNSSIYRNGDLIENIQTKNAWENTNSGAWVHYMFNKKNENPFGKLYNGYAVIDDRKLCPEGWRIPTKSDWIELREFNGGMNDRLRSPDYYKYDFTINDSTNITGFSMLPGGGPFERLGEIEIQTFFFTYWTNTSTNPNTLTIFGMEEEVPKKYAGFIRCLKE